MPLVAVLALGIAAPLLGDDIDPTPPERVSVLPVFFVPQGERPPNNDQKLRLMRHLQWARDWYRGVLGGRDTFRIARSSPSVIPGKHDLAFYKQQIEGGSPQFVSELLEKARFNRFNCPYIFSIVIMNPHEDFPAGGGRPFNGGFNTGGGLDVISSFALDKITHIQSTIRHELGHSFGLPHVNAYGYDMRTNRSTMSYNPGHHTNGFRDSATPAELIAENYRDLAMNKRCLEKFSFNPAADIAPGETLFQRAIWLGPMEIPGQPKYSIDVTTKSGETFGSRAGNIVCKWIRPSKAVEAGQKPGSNFDPSTMWHSAETPTGWVSLDLAFPFPVTLAKIGVHTQHSGEYHAAVAARLEVGEDSGFRNVAEKPLDKVDAQVAFPRHPRTDVAAFLACRAQQGGRGARAAILQRVRRGFPAGRALRRALNAAARPDSSCVAQDDRHRRGHSVCALLS